MPDKSNKREEIEAERKARALADLAELNSGAEGLPGTAMGRAYKGADDRLKTRRPRIDDADDKVEKWGRLIGRGLGFAALLYLVYHLVTTYLMK